MKPVLTALGFACATASVSAFGDAPVAPLATDASSVPEPGSLAIFALAMLAVWVVKRSTDGRKK
jgi:hypothetical protein